MKKFLSFFVAILVLGSLVSCGNDRDTLSACKAKRLFNKELQRTYTHVAAIEIPTGYFECNDEESRTQLRQLEANGLINYKCTPVVRMERQQRSRSVYRYDYWYGGYYDTEYYYVWDTTYCYFVDVSLTEAGQALVYERPEVKPTKEEKELREDFEVNADQYPEAQVGPEQFPHMVSKNDEIDATEETVDTTVAAYTDECAEATEEEVFDSLPEYTEPTVDPNASEYERNKAKEHIERVSLRAAELKVVKARNIVVHSRDDQPQATAQILMEYKNVTPVGRIFAHIYNGQRFLAQAQYLYFEDKGWKLGSTEE